MRVGLRTKFGLIALGAGAALVIVAVSSGLAARDVNARLDAIRVNLVPRIEARPRIESDFDQLRRGFQDSVAAQDVELLEQTAALRARIVRTLRDAGPALDRTNARALEHALDQYYDTAHDVSARLIAGESGESVVEDMEAMQAQQARVAELIERATALRENELETAFFEALAAERTASRVLLGTTVICVVLATILAVRLGRSVLGAVRALDAGFERFGRGEFDEPVRITSQDELADIAASANQMASSLRRLAEERAEAKWLEDGLAAMSLALRGELSLEEVGARALASVTRALDAPVGVLYFADEDGMLTLLAEHARVRTSEGAPSTLRIGEGLLGQAAKGTETTILADPPAGYLRVASALGEATPRAIALVPLRAGDDMLGVLELASLEPLSPSRVRFLNAVRESIAIAIRVAIARKTLRTLLARATSQAERLQRQEEDLRGANEELQSQQEELRQTNEELTHQTQELDAQRRVVESKNNELEEARLVLERRATELATVSAYKSQFLANMSHELRTPLNSMLLLSSLLAENTAGNLSPKQVEYCKTVHSAGTDLLALINQVLDLAKIEAGKQNVSIEPVSLTELAKHLRSTFEPIAENKGLRFAITIADELPESMETDRQRLTQVLNNLLSNAIKFTAQGSVRLTIARPARDQRFVRRALSDAPVLTFSVTDTGTGIDPAHRARIFEPFEQADVSTERRYGGTGLGLAIARELAGLLGGELDLVSTLGVGSTFLLHVPERLVVKAEPAREVTPPTPAPRPRAPSTGDAPILVVEDDEVFAGALADLVRDLGVRALVAHDGVSGLRMARESRPAGIVLDLMLPDIDGFEVMRRLRADEATASIPVHVVSAIEAGDRARMLGAVGYLAKPAAKADIVRSLEALVGRKRDRPLRVLVVEDDDLTGESLVAALLRERIDAKRVGNAEDALAALEQERFPCIVLDLSLPDMDGLTLLRRIAGKEGGESPSVIVYTARALSKEETQRLEAYAEAVVLKQGASFERLLHEIKLFTHKLKGTARAAKAEPAVVDARLRGRKLLLCDDDMRTVYALSAMLRSRGAEVLVADTGRAALDVLAKHPEVDAVLMDIMMPEMDGYEAMRRIRKDERLARLPIIALTAKAMLGDEEKCLEAGATAYLPKPIDPPLLFRTLGELMEGAR